MAFPKAIITKPFLISTAEYQEVGQNITLVGYDEFSQKMQESRNHASPRLLNWVEPYELSGERKTLFYTEVNSNIKVGEKVFIINGSYDSNLLIKKDKYKKGRDGYSVLRVEGCKIVLDISYTGTLPYKDEPIDDFIKVYYIDSEETFVAANRQMTTRGGKLDYKFNYGQNNIAFIDKSYGPIEEWGRNGGVYGVPGFFVREENTYLSSGVSIKEQWNNISDKLVYLGSFSVALSSTYKNNGKMLIMNGSFEYKGMEFREGVAYSWNEKKNVWESDPEYSAPIISKSNFRAGTFKGKFNNGAYGSLDKKISWTGKGTWNGGTILNSKWESGTMNSSISISPSVKAERDQYGIPFQKPNTSNNAGFGYNYVIGCDIDKSIVENGNFFGSKFTGDEGTYSVVEGHILNQELSYDNTINKAFFDSCEFRNIHIKSGEVKNTKAVNSRFTNIKALNSYFENSVMKDSTYVGDGVMKIIGYDEWNMSEYRSRTSGTYSYINQPNSKIYKFYISKESFDRMKAKDTFFIKGLKMKNSSRDMILDFFDSRFRLSTWTAYYDDLSISDPSLTRTPRNSFYKRGYEIAAFLSTPEENSYAISSYEDSYMIGGSGSVYLKYRSEIVGPNANKGYSIDIVVSRHDIFNKRSPLDRTSERIAPIPRDYNYGTEVATGTASMPNYIGDMVDFSNAYIIDADFHSGYIETSDWNSGYHINYNNDVALVGPTSTGRYAISIDNQNDYLVVDTPFNTLFPERPGEDSVLQVGEVVYLNAVDYDNRGMVAKVTLMATGSSYSTTNSTDPARLVNTKISGTTMSSVGSGYLSDTDVATLTKTGSGSGLTLNISAKPIGSVISITYSAPMTAGGSYSLNLSSAVSTNTGPIATASFTQSVLVDYNGSVTGVVNATYSVFGPPLSAATASAVANAIYATGPASSIESGLTVRYYTQTNGAISSLSVENPGIHYKVGQTFEIAGGKATFSIASISYGEITSYSIANPGEDYVIGDIVEIPKKFDPNSSISGATASITVTSITASYYDYKGLSLDITAEAGSIVGLTISNPGLFYEEGEIYTILGGNLNAIVKIESVTGSMVRLSDAYKIVDNSQGTIRLQELATQSVIAGLTGGGIFYTSGANNRWNYISKLKIDRSKIKSGIFRRPYITRSLIRDAGYVSADKDFTDSAKIKNLMVADAIFSSSGNILSSATYMHSSFCAGSDIWNDGIIFRSVVNGMTFSKGTVKTSMWMNGTFNGGTFYDSRSFNAQPGIYERSYESDSLWLYYVKGEVNAITDTVPVFNGRHAWINGTFNGGEFFKSDWNSGTFNNGLFYNSKFYSGTINNGIIGTKNVAASDTKIYSGTINYATVNNAYVYADDSGYEGLSYSLIQWNDGIFNSGVFGSNNDRLLGWTISTTKYDAYVGALPIKDYKITIATVSVTDTTPITGEFDIEVGLTLKHTYIGDLIINLMAPNGKIINLKKKYSGGSNDNMVGSVFTSDEDAPSIDIWHSPYTGKFKFANLIGQGVYYNLQGRSISGTYKAPTNELATIKGYISYIPSPAYDGDRWLVVATASDPTWNGQTNLFSSGFRNSIVEWKSATSTWIFPQDDSGRVLDDPKEGDIVTTESGETIVYYKSSWTKSYHSNTRKISDLLDSDKSIEGEWKLLVMDDAGIDIGFVDEFYVTFSYKNSYLIKSYKSDAIWYNGIFNGGQFVDLGIWKDGTFNGGKFISTYGWTSSGNYLNLEPSTDTFTWQDGIFNGGEFGNESLQANSTWRKGEFNGGIFKGRLWNDGIFTYGEFKGGSSLPAVGSTIDSESAQAFISEFIEGNYYGAWRKGMVSEKKDDFVTDKKLFTALQRSVKPVEKGKKAVFTNMLWLGGIFNHQAGEIKNSLWLDGLFKNGKMEGSAFNPYVRRYSDIREFSKDDSSIWENGRFSNGEFHYSKWMQGKFISGTAVGMIWKNGIANYMNAYNIFWENGIWRNGNWNGSYFDYSGKVEEEFAKEILNRGIEWSGTSSCHIWNMFESDADRTSRIVTSDPAQDSFATDNVDDAGVTPPFFTDPSNGVLDTSNYTIGNAQITFTVEVNMGGGTLSHVGIAYTTSATTPVPEDPIAVATVNTSGTVVINTSGTTKYKGISIYNNLTGQNNANISITSQPAALNVVSGIFQITVTGLLSTNYYNFMAVAVNREGVTTQILRNIQTTMPLTIPNAVVLDVGTPANPHPTSGSGNLEIPTTYKDPNLQSSLSDHNVNTDKVGVQFNVANNDGSQPAALSKSVTHVLNSAAQLATYVTAISSNNNTGTFKVRIPYGTGTNDLQGNTKYWFRTWISNEAGPVYSQVSSFTTGALPPAITQFTNPTTAAASTSLTMEIDNNGSSTLHAGFRIWLNSANPANNVLANSISANNILISPWSGGTGLTSFYTVYTTTSTQGVQTITLSLASLLAAGTLSPNTNYKVIGFAYDPIQSVVVSPNQTSPHLFKTDSLPAGVDTLAATENDSDGAKMKGELTSTGGHTILQRGFVYKRIASGQPYPTLTGGAAATESIGVDSGIVTVIGTAIGPFEEAVNGLEAAAEYQYRAYVITSAPTPASVFYGSQMVFETAATATISARSNSAPSISARSLSATTTVSNPGGLSATATLQISTGTGTSFGPSIVNTSLLPNKKYYVRARTVLSSGVAWTSTEETAWTLAHIVVNEAGVLGVSNITDSSATMTIKIPAAQGLLGQKGISVYPYGGDPASGNQQPISNPTTAGGEIYSSANATVPFTSLATGTRYEYTGYADAVSGALASPATPNPDGWNVNNSGASSIQRTYGSLFGEKASFWTKAKATTTSGSDTWTSNQLSLSFAISNAGGSSISEYGIIWKTGASPAAWTQAEVEAAVGDPQFVKIKREPQSPANISTSISATVTTAALTATTGAPGASDDLQIIAYVKNDAGIYADIAGQIFKNLA